VTGPALIQINDELANLLGIDLAASDESEIAKVFSGNIVPAGADPVAMAYAGHQFGHFVPQLGDGRALLLGEVTGVDHVHYGLHLKGSGRTYFSRNGDGRAALGPVLREYLVSEAMAKLNIPTTRALAAVTTGEAVMREQMLPGGVITRVASSFIRVGTFEYFRSRDNIEAITQLADHVIAQNYPTLAHAQDRYAALLQAVVERQAALIAQWMQVGFIHGVMNTDNMSIAGESIDYGPCAFIDDYQHDKVFSSIDRQGRYAYQNQPSIGLWNLTRFAECLIPCLADNTDQAVEIAQAILHNYIDSYKRHWLSGMRAKCGLTALAGKEDQDSALVGSLFDIMDRSHADFTLTFYYLSRLGKQPVESDKSFSQLFIDPAPAEQWLKQWRARLELETHEDQQRQNMMQMKNPVYIPRNHQIEAAIRAAEDHADFSVFYQLHEVLKNPFTEQAGKQQYLSPPTPEEVVQQTFCGT